MTRAGSTRAWRRLRAYVLERDQHQCQRPVQPTGRTCGAPASDCGHIVAHAYGGTDHPDNLRAECTFHNRGEGARIALRLSWLERTTKATP